MPFPHKFINLTPVARGEPRQPPKASLAPEGGRREERKRLERAIQTALVKEQYNERRRLQISLLSDDGNTFKQIAKRLNYCYRTIQNWYYQYQKEGFEGYLKHEK